MANRFPHLSGNVAGYPGAGRAVYDQIQGSFDPSEWTEGTTLTLMSVPWGVYQPGIMDHRPGFETVAERDKWFSERVAKSGESHVLDTAVRYQMDKMVELPFTFDYLSRYNYLIVDYGNAPLPNANGITRWFYHIVDIDYSAASTTQVTLVPDWWTTCAPLVDISAMILERGHAPVAETSVEAYLKDPLNNSDKLLAPDVDFGEGHAGRVSAFFDHVFNNDPIAVICFTNANNILTWSLENNAHSTSNAFVDGVPSSIAYAVDPSDLSGFIYAIDTHNPELKQYIQGIYFINRGLVDLDTGFVYHKIQVYKVRNGNAIDINDTLTKDKFAYDAKYADLAKLYTYPYAHLELTDSDGNVTEIKIEDLAGNGNENAGAQLRVQFSAAFPWIKLSACVSNMGGKRRTITFKNITSDIFAAGGKFGDTLMELNVPVFGVYQDPEKLAYVRGYYDRKQGVTDATVARDNAYNSAKCSYNNAVDSSNAAYNNAIKSANTAYANASTSATSALNNTRGSNKVSYNNSVRSAKTAKNNTVNSANNAANCSKASNATAYSNTINSNNTANTNAQNSNNAAYDNTVNSANASADMSKSSLDTSLDNFNRTNDVTLANSGRSNDLLHRLNQMGFTASMFKTAQGNELAADLWAMDKAHYGYQMFAGFRFNNRVNKINVETTQISQTACNYVYDVSQKTGIALTAVDTAATVGSGVANAIAANAKVLEGGPVGAGATAVNTAISAAQTAVHGYGSYVISSAQQQAANMNYAQAITQSTELTSLTNDYNEARYIGDEDWGIPISMSIPGGDIQYTRLRYQKVNANDTYMTEYLSNINLSSANASADTNYNNVKASCDTNATNYNATANTDTDNIYRTRDVTNANAERTRNTGNDNANRSAVTSNYNAEQSKNTGDNNAENSRVTNVNNATNTLNTATQNAADSYNVTDSNATRSYSATTDNAQRTMDASKQNAQRSRECAQTNAKRTYNTAYSNATRTYNNAKVAIDNHLKSANFNAPAKFGEFANGDTATTRPLMINVNIVTESPAAIAQAGTEFLRHGYALNQYHEFKTWNVMKNFSYWKCSDVWLTGIDAVPEQGQDAIRAMLYNGVTVWKEPDKIGAVSLYDN